eukprot:TRINITY_DN827_c0_g1_i1.p1 TRINITY_DN827_c0_g1~~TRINITY_DN827_c0_g1_i1.p1  ORF type:complete len:1002 (+),score=324.37 TRINITY_DN827_c0_g1_i1:84-3089(+)
MSSKCVVCGKAAYNMEKISVEGVTFHKTCFKCAECKATLKLGNYASLKGKYFCKPHFKQLFSLKGNYDEGFGSEQHKKKWLNKELGETNQETTESSKSDIHPSDQSQDRSRGRTQNQRSTSEQAIFPGVIAKGFGLNGAKIVPGEITVFTIVTESQTASFSLEDLSVTIEDKTNQTNIKPEVFDNPDGSYDVEWTPADGSHLVHVQIKGKHIKGSPFPVDIGVEPQVQEQSPQPQVQEHSPQPQRDTEQPEHVDQHPEISEDDIYPNAIVKGQGLNGSLLNPNEPSFFLIQCSDQSVTEEMISVKISGPSVHPKSEVYGNGDGTFDVEWTPPSLGRYSIEIQIDNKPLLGSPFIVFLGPLESDLETHTPSQTQSPTPQSSGNTKKIDPTMFEKLAKEQSDSKIQRSVETPEVHSRAALDRAAQFQKVAQDQSESKIKKMVNPNKIEGKKVDASEFEKLAKQEADSKVKRMVDMDSLSKETSGKRLDPSEFEKLAKQEAESRVKKMVDSPQIKPGVSAKEMTAAFENKKVTGVEVKRAVDSPSPTSKGNAKQITSLFENKNFKGVDVKRMVEPPSVQSKAALSRVAQFEQAAQTSKLKSRMVDVESVQEQTRGKKINPLEFEKLAKQQADSKVKRMVDLDKVKAEARGKKLNPEEFERKAKEDSDAKVKRMVDLDKVKAEARGKKLNAEDFERLAKEESDTKVKRMVDLDQVHAEARGKKLTPAEFEKKAKEEAESKVQRMVNLEKAQAEARGNKITPEEFERKAKEESETKVKRMVDPEKVQAEARGKKITSEEFERRAKEEAESKIKRMADPEAIKIEARGQTNVLLPTPQYSGQTDEEDDSENLLSQLGTKLSVPENVMLPTPQNSDQTDEQVDSENLLSQLGTKLSIADSAEESHDESRLGSNTLATGLGLHRTGNRSGELTVFTVCPKDTNGDAVSVKTSDITIRITGPGNPSHEIFDNEDKTFDVEWEPMEAGEYQVDIRVVGEPVKNSPFTVVVS